MAELGSDQGPPTRSWKELLTGFWFCILIIKLVQVCGFKKKKTPKDPQQQNKPNQSCRRGPEKGTSVTPAHRGAAPLPDLPDEDRPAQGGARPRSSHRLVPLCSPVLLSLVCVAWLVSSRHGPLLPPPARQLRGLRATRRGPAGRAPASAPKGAGSLALLQVWGSRLAGGASLACFPIWPMGVGGPDTPEAGSGPGSALGSRDDSERRAGWLWSRLPHLRTRCVRVCI